MKILIIGGNRFFGYHIAKRLIQDGHDVALFNRCHTWMRNTIRWYTEEYKGYPSENYWLRDKEVESIRRYKDAYDLCRGFALIRKIT